MDCNGSRVKLDQQVNQEVKDLLGRLALLDHLVLQDRWENKGPKDLLANQDHLVYLADPETKVL